MERYNKLSDIEILQITGGGSVCETTFNVISAITAPLGSCFVAIAAKTPNVALANPDGSPMMINGQPIMTMTRQFYLNLILGNGLIAISLGFQAFKSAICGN